ncbi:PAS domain S-box protein [Planctomycetota bacterium]
MTDAEKSKDQLIAELQELRESEARYRTVVEEAAEAIVIADIETLQLKYANRAACTVFGFGANEVTGKTVRDVHPKDAAEQGLAEFEAAVKGRKHAARAVPCLRQDGSTFYANIEAARTMIGGRPSIVGYFMDVTVQQAAEERVQKLNEKLKQRVEEQSRSILELATPVVRLWDEIVVLPLVGVIDTARAQLVIESLLNAIVRNEARVAIIDVTGVPTVDSLVAQHLIKAGVAAKMLGAAAIVTGFSPETALTLTRLQVDLSSLRTAGTLRSGIATALELVGMQVVPTKEAEL